jgi:hypothetical protein
MTRNHAQAIALAFILTAASPASHADAVADWNKIALDTVVASSRSSEQALKAMTTVHTAMFEALNFVDPRYKSQYTVESRAQPGAPHAAVAAGAAHHILAELYPARAAALRQALKRSLSAIEDQQAAYAGTITGKSIAQIVWAVRASEHGEAAPRRDGAAAAFDRVNGRPRWDVELRSLNSAIAGLIETQRLDLIDSARIHALAAGAAADATSAPAEVGTSIGFRIGAIVQAALRPELSASGR